MSNSPTPLILIRRFVVMMIIAVTIVAAVPDVAFAKQDAVLGTWKFLPKKSTFTPGPAPYRSLTLNFTATEAGLRNEAKGVGANGAQVDATYEVVTDGKYHPVTGLSAFDSSSYTPVSDRTTVYVRRKHGASVIAGSRVLSRDGGTLFYREKSIDSQGRETGRATLVFEKQ